MADPMWICECGEVRVFHPGEVVPLPIRCLHCGKIIPDYMSSVCPAPDPVSHPAHYTSHPSGVECIQITEHMGFCVGNAIKYLWRAGLKQDAIEDLKKAAWYVNREIERRTRA